MHRIKKAYFKLSLLLTFEAVNLIANQSDYPCISYDRVENFYLNELFCSSCQHFCIQGDILYWTPRITGLELNFGTTNIVEEINGCSQILTTEEFDLDPHFNWDNGYRIGVGYEVDQWKAEGLWTHFQGNGKRNFDNLNHGKVKIKLDQVDLLFSHQDDFDCNVTIKSFIGTRITRIHETINSFLVTEISLFPDILTLETKNFHDRQHYWGFGPLLGIQGEWNINCGLSLYGSISAGLLYGNYQVYFNDRDVFDAPISKEILSINNRHMHAFDFNFDFALGIKWHTTICRKYDVNMKVGIEQHQYMNQNRLCAGRGDVSFTGGVFSLELCF